MINPESAINLLNLLVFYEYSFADKQQRTENLRSNHRFIDSRDNCMFYPFGYALLVSMANYHGLPAHCRWLLLRVQIQLQLPNLLGGIQSNGVAGFFCPPRNQHGTKNGALRVENAQVPFMWQKIQVFPRRVSKNSLS
jgi:hypothetical protein